MQKRLWSLGVAGLALVCSACASESTVSQPPASAPISSTSAPGAAVPNPVAAQPPAPAPVVPPPPPTVQVSRAVSPDRLPVPPLTPPTSTLQRLPQISSGRSNPFASVAEGAAVEVSPAAPAPTALTRPAIPPAPVVVSSAPGTAPAVPPAVPSAVPPAVTVPAAPTAVPVPPRSPAPIALAQQIEISGLVQVGNRINIIVQVPQEGTSRTVGAGEYLGNGAVLVKRIEVLPNREPRVILEQSGVEIVRTVGDNPSLVSAR